MPQNSVSWIDSGIFAKILLYVRSKNLRLQDVGRNIEPKIWIKANQPNIKVLFQQSFCIFTFFYVYKKIVLESWFFFLFGGTLNTNSLLFGKYLWCIRIMWRKFVCDETSLFHSLWIRAPVNFKCFRMQMNLRICYKIKSLAVITAFRSCQV